MMGLKNAYREAEGGGEYLPLLSCTALKDPSSDTASSTALEEAEEEAVEVVWCVCDHVVLHIARHEYWVQQLSVIEDGF